MTFKERVKRVMTHTHHMVGMPFFSPDDASTHATC